MKEVVHPGERRNDERENEANRWDEKEAMKEVVIPANAGIQRLCGVLIGAGFRLSPE
jgi:hypothetical protein